MVHAGTEDGVVISYIDNSASPFGLTSEDILYLHNAGLSSTEIVAMIRHDRLLREMALASANQANPPIPDDQSSPPPQPTETQDYAAAGTDGYDTNSPEPDNYFSNYLAPYGSWSNLPGYGWGWQPTVAVASPGWTPYCDGGQWFYTDRGWYWNSYYPWGWAPFHYGRWSHNPQRGWLWFPGRTWAPSWVTWRTSNDCVGWAPLPPGSSVDAQSSKSFKKNKADAHSSFNISAQDFTFVDSQNFGAMNLRSCCFDRSMANKAFVRSRAVNNFAAAPDGSVSNWGPDFNRVSHSSKNPIVKADLQDSPSLAGAGVVASRSRDNPAKVHIFRPRLFSTAPSVQSTQSLLSGEPPLQSTQQLLGGQPPLLDHPQPSSKEAATIGPSVPGSLPAADPGGVPPAVPGASAPGVPGAVPPAVPGAAPSGPPQDNHGDPPASPRQNPNGTFRFHSAFNSSPGGGGGGGAPGIMQPSRPSQQPRGPSAHTAPAAPAASGGKHN